MREAKRGLRWAAALVVVATLGTACASKSAPPASSPVASSTPDPTTLVGHDAPNFSLVDQFGQPKQLGQYQGKVVLLTFVSSHCTTICPLTAEMLSQTQDLLGPDAKKLQLVAVNANPVFRSVGAVMRWSKLHAMVHRWVFLTGSVPQLTTVYKDYGIQPGSNHTTLVFVIDGQGRIKTLVPIAQKKSLDAEAKVLAKYVRGVESS